VRDLYKIRCWRSESKDVAFTQNIGGRYKDANSQVSLKIFEGKSHFICGVPGWEKVADYVLSWYESL